VVAGDKDLERKTLLDPHEGIAADECVSHARIRRPHFAGVGRSFNRGERPVTVRVVVRSTREPRSSVSASSE